MLYEIKHWHNGRVIATQEGDSQRVALELLVKTGAVLTGADLTGAVLTGADLRGADLTGAVLTGVPVVAALHRSMLAAIDAGGKLEMGSWHQCETTHCRAGWAVTLAGEAGRALEDRVGPAAAGALITLASCPWMERVPNFYAANETALADIQACAEREETEAANAR